MPLFYPSSGARAVGWAFLFTALGCLAGMLVASAALRRGSRRLVATLDAGATHVPGASQTPTLPAELALLERTLAGQASRLRAIFLAESRRAERLRAEILTDAVSGLESRSAFQLSYLNQLELNRDITSGTLVLLKVEGLDELKVKSGGEALDLAVRLVASRLISEGQDRQWLRGRMSIGSFAVAMPGTSASVALVQANSLVSSIRNELVSGFPESHFACEAGAVYFEGRAPDLATLLSAAEAAAARARTRSALVEFDIHQSVDAEKDNLWWNEALRSAIEKDNIRILGQKVLGAGGRDVSQLELLTRIYLPRTPELPAQQFMPVAAQCKLVPSFDLYLLRWVRRNALVVAGAMGAPRVAVNLGSQSMGSDAVYTLLGELLSDQALAERMAFEISEISLAGDPEGVKRLSALVKASRALWGIDHFGLGPDWSVNLDRYRPDYVKLAGSYVDALIERESGRALLAAVVSSARALGIAVYVSPVENPSVLPLLCDLGVAGGQGAKLHAPVILNAA